MDAIEARSSDRDSITPSLKTELAKLLSQSMEMQQKLSYLIEIQERELSRDRLVSQLLSRDRLVSQLGNLRQRGTVNEYVEQFERLRRPINCYYSDKYFLNIFVNGLHKEIRLMVKMVAPSTLKQAIHIAREREQVLDALAETCLMPKQITNIITGQWQGLLRVLVVVVYRLTIWNTGVPFFGFNLCLSFAQICSRFLILFFDEKILILFCFVLIKLCRYGAHQPYNFYEYLVAMKNCGRTIYLQ